MRLRTLLGLPGLLLLSGVLTLAPSADGQENHRCTPRDAARCLEELARSFHRFGVLLKSKTDSGKKTDSGCLDPKACFAARVKKCTYTGLNNCGEEAVQPNSSRAPVDAEKKTPPNAPYHLGSTGTKKQTERKEVKQSVLDSASWRAPLGNYWPSGAGPRPAGVPASPQRNRFGRSAEFASFDSCAYECDYANVTVCSDPNTENCHPVLGEPGKAQVAGVDLCSFDDPARCAPGWAPLCGRTGDVGDLDRGLPGTHPRLCHRSETARRLLGVFGRMLMANDSVLHSRAGVYEPHENFDIDCVTALALYLGCIGDFAELMTLNVHACGYLESRKPCFDTPDVAHYCVGTQATKMVEFDKTLVQTYFELTCGDGLLVNVSSLTPAEMAIAEEILDYIQMKHTVAEISLLLITCRHGAWGCVWDPNAKK